MKDRQKALDQLYNRDPETDSYVINVIVKKYENIFNNLDPSPFKRRDLDSSLVNFLEDCSMDIPLHFKTLIQFQVPHSIRNEVVESRIISGLGNYFSYIMSSYARRIKMMNERSMYFVGISFLLLLSASFMASLDIRSILFQTINEGVFIGGWVFMWEAISSYSIKKKEIKHEYRHYKRFCHSPIKFCSYDVDRNGSRSGSESAY